MIDLMFTAQEWAILALSFQISILAVLFMLPLALAAAYVLARVQFWGHGIFNAVVHLPLVLPPVVSGYLLLMIFGRGGVIGDFLLHFGISLPFTTAGASLTAAVMAFPLVVRSIRLAIEGVDQRLESAAMTLGASRFSVFCTVTLPLIMSGMIAGCVLGFAKALGEFGATITFAANIAGETQTLSSAIYEMLQIPGQDAAVTRLIILSFILSFAALALSEWLAKRVQCR